MNSNLKFGNHTNLGEKYRDLLRLACCSSLGSDFTPGFRLVLLLVVWKLGASRPCCRNRKSLKVGFRSKSSGAIGPTSTPKNPPFQGLKQGNHNKEPKKSRLFRIKVGLRIQTLRHLASVELLPWLSMQVVPTGGYMEEVVLQLSRSQTSLHPTPRSHGLGMHGNPKPSRFPQP